ncbi:hypothetical protein Q7C_1369 [Methylophaga frappieri]|uniref:DUF393 domain-containing protein n=2 Tax=Methylophaga frappieri (strain ATCC BAA-2434 / DSM 25690 / JAM7) TaxID=754477 RepID=I1YHX6_METFJ|nr:hypothetical protein Q7C_1369 [Methylophaga frappieri]
MNIRDSVGELTLIDARQHPDKVSVLQKKGFDLDAGMILKVEEQYYLGAEAMHVLALLSSRSGVFNRLNYWLFRSKWLAKILYPVLRGGRHLLLKLLGRSSFGDQNNAAK